MKLKLGICLMLMALSAIAAAPPAAPVLLESLLLPAAPPAGGQYALQAGQFASEEAAIALTAQLTRQKLPAPAPLKAVDPGGKIWYIVTIGPYTSLEEARAARTKVGLTIGLGGLPAILLPAPPKS